MSCTAREWLVPHLGTLSDVDRENGCVGSGLTQDRIARDVWNETSTVG